jgi:hypothetical protein
MRSIHLKMDFSAKGLKEKQENARLALDAPLLFALRRQAVYRELASVPSGSITPSGIGCHPSQDGIFGEEISKFNRGRY